MTAWVAPRRRDRVLEIGTGTGYQTAILARLASGGRVYTIERLPDLLVEAEERFRRLGLTNIETRLGDGAHGWPDAGPFDVIVVTAAAPATPAPLLEQLAIGGRMIIPIGDRRAQDLVVYRRTVDGVQERSAGSVRFVPLISRSRVRRAAVTLRRHADLLGAHVSTMGGVATAPPRAAAIGATAMQIFTKTPNQWREPTLTAAHVAEYRAALARSGVQAVVSHDSYLINLASPDPVLRARSAQCFVGELSRCLALGIPWVVSHPGNFMDERAAGLDRNAREYAACLAAVPGDVGVLIEGTAGAGTALGATFEELRALRDALPAAVRAPRGVLPRHGSSARRGV